MDPPNCIALPRLSVDGQIVEPYEFFLHYQLSPFPGGHEYAWTIPRKLLPTWLRNALSTSPSSLSSDTYRQWFFWLDIVVGKWQRALPDAVNNELKYVLNSIDFVDSSNDLQLRGRCSDYIRPAKTQ